jgi:hypothetical protein
MDEVQHRAVARDLLLAAIRRGGLLGHERLDPLARRGYVLDRVGRLRALDPRDFNECLQRLRALAGKGRCLWCRFGS